MPYLIDPLHCQSFLILVIGWSVEFFQLLHCHLRKECRDHYHLIYFSQFKMQQLIKEFLSPTSGSLLLFQYTVKMNEVGKFC